MTTIEDKIAQAETKLKQLKAAKQKVEARKRAIELNQRKKDDTRRKVLIGAAIMAMLDSGRMKQEKLMEIMDGFLTREAERALFGLTPAGVAEASPPAEAKPAAPMTFSALKAQG